MFNIAICDDQMICAETLELSVRKIMDETKKQYNIDIYTSGKELLSVLGMGKNMYDLLLLDIIMGEEEMNGMEVAKAIRTNDDTTTIVFVTSSTDFILDGYSVRALQYLIKPVDEKILREVLTYELNSKTGSSIVFKEKDATKRVAPSDIVHIETSGRNVKVVLVNDEFNAYNKISDVEKILPAADFIRCHQSFIVNINNISEIRHGEAISVKGDSIPISRTQWAAVKKMFIEKK